MRMHVKRGELGKLAKTEAYRPSHCREHTRLLIPCIPTFSHGMLPQLLLGTQRALYVLYGPLTYLDIVFCVATKHRDEQHVLMLHAVLPKRAEHRPVYCVHALPENQVRLLTVEA